MEDRKIDKVESLELITLMIKNARTNLRARINCNILLGWGYTVVSISLVVWFLKAYNIFMYSSLLWLLIPIIGFSIAKYFSSKDKASVKSYLDKTIDYISVLFAIICSVLGLLAIWTDFPILFIEGVLFSMWIIIIGILIKYMPVIYGGITGLAISLCLLLVHGEVWSIFVFAFIPVFSLIIPGRIFKKSLSENV